MRQIRRIITLAVLGAVLLLSVASLGVATASSGDSPGEVDVSLEPANQTVETGEEAAYDIVVEGPTQGISAYMMTIELGNASVATVEAFEHAHSPAFDETNVTADGVSVSAALGDNTIPAGEEVVLGTLTVSGQAAGVTDVALDDESVEITLDDEEVTPYAVGTVTDGSLEVTANSGPEPVGNNGAPPKDLNGDTLYEDIDGDGAVTIFDVQALFEHIDSQAVQDHASAFNFDGGSGDSVTIFDVQTLFDVVKSGP